MKNPVSRRGSLKGIGAGVALLISKSTAHSAESGTKKLAIDRSNIDWEGRPMYLRAYHPPYLVYYYGMMRENQLNNPSSIVKWSPLVERVENEPELRILLIQAYDDACAGCYSLEPDPHGHPWGVGYSCHASLEKVKQISHVNRRILGELGLYFGSEIPMRDLVPLLAENVPVLYEGIGGEGNQELYEKGLAYLKKKYGV